GLPAFQRPAYRESIIAKAASRTRSSPSAADSTRPSSTLTRPGRTAPGSAAPDHCMTVVDHNYTTTDLAALYTVGCRVNFIWQRFESTSAGRRPWPTDAQHARLLDALARANTFQASWLTSSKVIYLSASVCGSGIQIALAGTQKP
ncbi:hypothetical protein L249_6632, partial [Ophiocordyceps polyrhachis-furcata BCC 54312]